MTLPVERWLGTIAGLAAGLGVLYYLYGPRIQDVLDDQPPEVENIGAPEPAAAEAPRVEYPVPDAPPPTAQISKPEPEPDRPARAKPAKPAPAQQEQAPATPEATDVSASDDDVREEMFAVFGEAPVESFLIPERVIQNIVATIDSLDREPVPLRFRAVTNVPDLPVVEHEGDSITLSPDNAERYRTVIDALQQADSQQIAAVYLRYYPLFQQAYREMGYPKSYFNDRVVKVIDHLLATPDVAGPIELVRPKVLYEFADPALEERSSGQKMLIRIGPDNAAVVKAKLREVRAVITSGKATATRPEPPQTQPHPDAG
jgi:hypothetical protein